MNRTDFISKILPGNYNLTKSMEISKITSSGTLWYTKKFLVLYNIIFLNSKLDTIEYFETINDIFLKYIKSLDSKVQEDATNYFFNGYKKFDSSKTKSFNDFIESVNYTTREEANRSKLIAKKYYFVYLMGTGGQTGVKKEIKDYLYSNNFKFSVKKLENIIRDFNTRNGTKHNVNGMINDYVGSIRNERQILYYYGFFHSKNAGAYDIEFSSLTPIGELAYVANSPEFQVLWEHQKLKMVSQPMNVEIKNVANIKKDVNFADFSINYSPYFDILRYLNSFKHLPFNVYQYLLSRNKESQNLFEENIPHLKENMNLIMKKVKDFGRTGDVKKEDFQKELKKYLLGITNHVKKDKKTNILGVIDSFSNIKILDEKKFNTIYKIYGNLESYKRKKYKSLFNSVNEELKRYYLAQSKNKSYEKSLVINTNWNLYNGKVEDSILINIMYLYIILALNKNEDTIEVMEFIDSYKNMFPNISSYLNYNKRELKELFNMRQKEEMIIIEEDLEDGDISEPESAFLEASVQDLKNKISYLSEDTTYHFIINQSRQRNQSLIAAMKQYYIKRYDTRLYLTNESIIKCECCKQGTFITERNQPYMEFHHIIPFGGSTKGQDHYLNLINLCPTCHTKFHRINREKKEILYGNVDENNYIRQTIKERLYKLKEKGLLKSYQLEFLLSERAITQKDYNEIGEYNAE